MSRKITVPVHDREVLHPLYGEILLYVAANHGVGVEQLLSPAEALQLRSRHRPSQFFQLIGRLREQCPDPGLAVEFGKLIDLTAAGVIGQAVMSAATVGESFRLIRRYYPLTGLYFDINASRAGEELRINFDVAYEDISEIARGFLLEALVNSWGACFKVLRGEEMPIRQLLFDFSPTGAATWYREVYGAQMHSGAGSNLVTMDFAQVDAPTVTGNYMAHLRTVAHCEASLLKNGALNTVADKVRRQLRRSESLASASLELVAGMMNISGRTLTRRLQVEEVTFKELLDGERKRRACRMLQNTPLPIDQIGEKLGYSDASNFRRAFKKWTGQSPSSFRQSFAD